MNTIRIKNLRSLVDTGPVELRPITLLLGQNSSGKSTFLRSFPLLRQSVESPTSGPMLWYGRYVDFGEFDEAIRRGSSPPIITFEYRAPLLDIYASTSRRLTSLLSESSRQGGEISLALELGRDEQDASTKAHGCRISFADHVIELKFDNRGNVTYFMVNSLDLIRVGAQYSARRHGSYLPLVSEVEEPVEDEDTLQKYPQRRTRKGADRFLFREVKSLFHANTSNRTIWMLIGSLGIGTSNDMLRHMQSLRKDNATWKRRVSQLTLEDEKFQHIRDLNIASRIYDLLAGFDQYLGTLASRVAYVAPLRALAERYYRPQDLSVEEVDSQGANLPMFLRNLSNDQRKDFADWTQENLGFSVAASSSSGHISLMTQEGNHGNQYNIADVGFGVSQLLPIAAQIWSVSRAPSRRSRQSPMEHFFLASRQARTPSILAIEQPELHLHPGLQARVADLMVNAVETAHRVEHDLRLVIETHSETIVNHLGHRIAAGDLDQDDVQIVLFERTKPDYTEVRLVQYDEEGFLTNWPFGFFEPDQYSSYDR